MAVIANPHPEEGLVFSPSKRDDNAKGTALVQALVALRSKYYVELQAARERAKRNFVGK